MRIMAPLVFLVLLSIFSQVPRGCHAQDDAGTTLPANNVDPSGGAASVAFSVQEVINKKGIDDSYPPVNIDYLGAGYDLVYGNPSGDSLSDLDPGFRRGAVALAFVKNRTCADFTSLCPVGGYARKSHSCRNNERAKELNTVDSYQSDLRVDASMSFSAGPVDFSASVGYGEFRRQNQALQRTAFSSKTVCSVYDAWLDPVVDAAGAPTTPRWTPTQFFHQTVSRLPSSFSPDTDWSVSPFRNFIELFGTHYVSWVRMGGKRVRRTYLTNSDVAQFKKDNVDVSLAASYSGLAASGSVSFSMRKASESYAQIQTKIQDVSEATIGGDPNADWTTWAATVPARPMPVQYKLSEIANIVAAFHGTSKGRAVRQAVQYYFTTVNQVAANPFTGDFFPTPLINVAFSQRATQSSTYKRSDAINCVDGERKGDNAAWGAACQTNLEAKPWWRVQFGALASIRSVEVYPCQVVAGTRTPNQQLFQAGWTRYNVSLLDANDVVVWTSAASPLGDSGITILDDIKILNGSTPARPIAASLRIDFDDIGQQRVLCLSEVVVYGYNLQTQYIQNVATLPTAIPTMSTQTNVGTVFNGPSSSDWDWILARYREWWNFGTVNGQTFHAAYAVDNNIYSPAAVACSTPSSQPWWRLQLPQAHRVVRVVVFLPNLYAEQGNLDMDLNLNNWYMPFNFATRGYEMAAFSVELQAADRSVISRYILTNAATRAGRRTAAYLELPGSGIDNVVFIQVQAIETKTLMLCLSEVQVWGVPTAR